MTGRAPIFVGHDLGTGGDKAVVVDAAGQLLAERVAPYALDRPGPGRAEQDPEAWWQAVARATREALADSGRSPRDVAGVAFAGQMLSLVPLDEQGRPTRPAIVWMDARAEEEARRIVRRLGGERVLHLLAGGSPTGKDLVAKVAWLRAHEPEVFRRTAAFSDATGFLVARATGRVALDPTAAGATGLLDLGDRSWSRVLAWLVGFPLDRVPPLVASTRIAGGLRGDAARDLGLPEGVPVAAGCADIPSAALGSGAVRPGEAHVYLGTSAWIGVSAAGPKSAPRAGIASIPSAGESGCILVGETETAGACRDWARRFSPGLDEAGFDALAARAEPGAGGVLFLPWLYGERSPVPDTSVRGAFVNLSLEHGPAHLARAVLEGVAHNLRWVLDELARLGEPCEALRAIGGGATSELWLQTLADVTGRVVERVAHPRQAGAVGSALLAAVATGALPDVTAIARTVRIDRAFTPVARHRALFDDRYACFRGLYRPLSELGRRTPRLR